MAKLLEKIIIADLKKRFSFEEGCLLIDYHGLDAERTMELRGALREKKSNLTVIRNRLAERAWRENEAVPEEFLKLLKGPTAVIHGESVRTTSKVLSNWHRKNRNLATIKGGLFEGKVLTAEEVRKLAAIPDRETLQAQISARMLGPLQSLASAAQQLVSHLAGCARARHEELSGEE